MPKPLPPSAAVTPQASSSGVTVLDGCNGGLEQINAFLIALFLLD